jgi:hypothetical protein
MRKGVEARAGQGHDGREIRGPRGLRREGAIKRITAYVPVKMWREFRVQCAGEERSMSEVLTESVAEWLERRR